MALHLYLFPPCNSVSADPDADICACRQSLTTLHLAGLPRLSDKAIATIAAACPRLRTLVLASDLNALDLTRSTKVSHAAHKLMTSFAQRPCKPAQEGGAAAGDSEIDGQMTEGEAREDSVDGSNANGTTMALMPSLEQPTLSSQSSSSEQHHHLGYKEMVHDLDYIAHAHLHDNPLQRRKYCVVFVGNHAINYLYCESFTFTQLLQIFLIYLLSLVCFYARL